MRLTLHNASSNHNITTTLIAAVGSSLMTLIAAPRMILNHNFVQAMQSIWIDRVIVYHCSTDPIECPIWVVIAFAMPHDTLNRQWPLLTLLNIPVYAKVCSFYSVQISMMFVLKLALTNCQNPVVAEYIRFFHSQQTILLNCHLKIEILVYIHF